MDAATKIATAIELLNATKRDLQILDAHIEQLQQGRPAVETADDVSSEHRASWLGVVDDIDQSSGILLGSNIGLISPGLGLPLVATQNFGLTHPKTGTIRNQEDAAFVCTGVLCAVAKATTADPKKFLLFYEDMAADDGEAMFSCNPALRLTDANTGRALITGMTEKPKDLARGAIPFTYFSSIRPGLGSNVKNKLFSEFTIPRAGNVKVEVFNLGLPVQEFEVQLRVCVTLLGYKVFGA